MPSICLVLPLYNEIRTIPRTFGLVQEYGAKHPEITFRFVDDGSIDGTAEFLESVLAPERFPQIQLIRSPRNGGKGRAVQLGFSQSEEDYLIFSDGDLAYSLDHIPLMIEKLVDYPVVIGSRELKPYRARNSSLRRQVLGRAFNALTRAITGLPYRDTQAGLKGFQKLAARKIFACHQIQGFGFDVELLYLAHKFNYRVAEIYAQVNAEHSYKIGKLKLLRDSCKMFVDLLCIRWHDCLGHYESKS